VSNPAPLLQKIADLLDDVQVLSFDHACAEQFGKVRGSLLQQGISVPTADLMIAAVALVHNLTLVPITRRILRVRRILSVANLQVAGQVASHVQLVLGQPAGNVERLGMVKQLHLLLRHGLNHRTESICSGS
jgi:hypothetical protein